MSAQPRGLPTRFSVVLYFLGLAQWCMCGGGGGVCGGGGLSYWEREGVCQKSLALSLALWPWLSPSHR